MSSQGLSKSLPGYAAWFPQDHICPSRSLEDVVLVPGFVLEFHDHDLKYSFIVPRTLRASESDLVLVWLAVHTKRLEGRQCFLVILSQALCGSLLASISFLPIPSHQP
ncbi:hypothetical protein BOTBODRAFT_543325 [Botryobasidium botryosum FD-172 SS1]|uniref:Uncharacterized protein n=1 Tax=Botryobasidium botryosum (strain FD-172 SS1) TaxID=930990 RepID=A0A067MT86_BOTB1|nr:hypothetical protein BOTBODRAFT_543325 [Botryobasidium botryosum FD-172 SS1]